MLRLVLAIFLVISMIFIVAWFNREINDNGKQSNNVSVFFRLATDRNSAEERGVISANGVTPKKVSDEVLAAIKNNLGLKTGTDFDSSLEITEECQLFGVNIKLSDQSDIQQWLVSPLPPCGKDEYASLNSPFWLVEQKDSKKPEVLLAYRAYTLYLLHKSKHIHEGYVDVLITYQSLDGNDKSIEWYYKNGKYNYKSSVCSNLNPINADEPAFFKDCARVEAW